MESVLAYMGNDISTLAGLKVATGKDANSISAWPDYNGTTCLIPYAGSPVLDICPALVITDDYNGIARTVPASMGAYEVPGDFTSPVITYDPLDNTNFTGSRTLDAVINDYHGSVPVSGLGAPRLYWRFGNGAWNIVTSDWVGGNTFRFTFGAGAVLGNTVSYFIVAQDNENTANCGAFPLSGATGFGINPPSCSTAPSNPSTYTIVNGIAGIKNIPGDYSNLTGINGLFADINSKVLTGPLTVNIGGNLAEDGSVALNEINVTDTAFHLCIQVPGNTYRLISGGYSGGLIRFNGADGVSLKGNGKLKIVNTNTTPSIIISLSNGSNSNVIEGCKLVCGSSYMSSTNSGIMLSGANSNNIIRNDTINKCYNAVYMDGTYWNQSSNNKVYSNTLGSTVTSDYIYQIGIAAFYQDQLLIKGNEIFNVISNNSPKAIYTEGLTNSTIEKNNIHDIYYNGTSYGGASGITIKALNNNPNVLIKNNLIRKISGMGSSPNISDENSIPAGIKLFGNATSGINVYNNSVYMIPDPVYGLFYNNEWFTAVEIGAGVSGINMADNILQNSVGERTGSNLTSYGYAVYCKSTVSPFATINNNIYYTTGFDNNFVGLYGTAVPPVNNMNLASWKTFTGQDTQSLNIDPAFTSLTSLVPLPASPAIGSGLPLPGIVDEDYLANPRGNPTTIGAYELVSASSKTLNLTLFLEGLYAGSGTMYQSADENGPHFTAGIADQISVELHSAANYASKLFTATGINLSTLGHAQLTTPAGMSGNYYVTIRHRNSIETVSAVPVSFSGTNISYNFTGDASAAYGNNMKDLGEGLYGIFGGDSNNDGAVDALDLISIDNDASGFMSGYTTTDLNGDGVVDALDLIMADNNASQFISLITP
jgi:hypothetical protein